MSELSEQLDQLDYYTLLGVRADATVDELRAAFHSFAQRYHPDQYVEASVALREEAAAVYRRGAEAYRALTDPTLRELYHRVLGAGRVRLTGDEELQTGARASLPPGASPRTAVPGASAKARALIIEAKRALESGDRKKAILNVQIAERSDPAHPDLAKIKADLGLA